MHLTAMTSGGVGTKRSGDRPSDAPLDARIGVAVHDRDGLKEGCPDGVPGPSACSYTSQVVASETRTEEGHALDSRQARGRRPQGRGGGYWAEVPALPGCFSQAETLAELRRKIQEAVDLYLDVDVAKQHKDETTHRGSGRGASSGTRAKRIADAAHGGDPVTGHRGPRKKPYTMAKTVSGKRFCRALEHRGWVRIETKSGHRKYEAPDGSRTVIVPVHGTTDLKRGLLE